MATTVPVIPYVHQEYPKYLYHATEKPRIVADADAHQKAGQGWYPTVGEAVDAMALAVSTIASTPAAVTSSAGTYDSVIAATPFTAERDAFDAAALYEAAVPEIIARIPGTTEIMLRRLLAFEEKNPKYPGGRKLVLRAVEEALTAPQKV